MNSPAGNRPLRVLHAVLVGVGALLAAFFLVFAGVFTDGPRSLADPERIVSLALVLAAYVILGVVAVRWSAQHWWRWALSISGPAALILLLYSIGEYSGLGLHLIYLTCVLAGAFVGAWLGDKWRRTNSISG